jgi:DnaK suppressor protein
MAVKKPSAKATKAKKTVARKPESKGEPKKVVVAKKTPAAATTVAARAKPAAKSTSKTTVTTPITPSKPPASAQKSPPLESEAEGAVTPAAPAPVAKPAAATPKVPTHGSAIEKSAASPPALAARATMSSKPPEQVMDNSADNDDGEGPELSSTNLLAGPRNVKPYIPRRGEQYMGKEQLEHFRQILNTWKRDLMQEVDRTVLHMKDEAANFPDPNDRATQESEFSLELRTRDRERKLIRKIDEAIKRIEDGSYGYCVETGEEIGIKRLEARPVATLCVEAQERRERREKQYGDRDDRYR